MATAQIRWLWADEGGRLYPPPGPRYSTVARFEAQTAEDWRSNAWSLVMEFHDLPDESGYQTAAVRFLSIEGPTKWLEAPSRFSLYEGDKKVAEGIVLRQP
jgi:hypothetical protein